MLKTTCSRCHINPRLPKSKYCNPCHASYMRRWRQTHPISAEERVKMNCRSYAHVYLKRGKLTKEPCVVCGDSNSQMHHDDYSKPLQVTWLCRKHHLDLHRSTPGS